MSDKPESTASHLARFVAVLVFVLALYLGAYAVLLESKVYRQTGVDSKTGQNLFNVEPRYRVNESWVESALRPAQWIDRHVRNEYWVTIEHSNGRKWKNPAPPAARP